MAVYREVKGECLRTVDVDQCVQSSSNLGFLSYVFEIPITNLSTKQINVVDPHERLAAV